MIDDGVKKKNIIHYYAVMIDPPNDWGVRPPAAMFVDGTTQSAFPIMQDGPLRVVEESTCCWTANIKRASDYKLEHLRKRASRDTRGQKLRAMKIIVDIANCFGRID